MLSCVRFAVRYYSCAILQRVDAVEVAVVVVVVGCHGDRVTSPSDALLRCSVLARTTSSMSALTRGYTHHFHLSAQRCI